MSELQLGLLIVGSIVIVGVVAYNRIQESRFRRRAERAFAPDRADALMEPTRPPGERIEPQLQPSSAAPEIGTAGRHEPRGLAPLTAPVSEEVAAIHYVAEIHDGALRPEALKSVLAEVGTAHSRVHFEAAGEDGAWVAVQPDSGGTFKALRVLMLLADRRGAVTAQDLATLQSAVARCAAAASASAEIPPSGPALQRAQELDAFCAKVDVVVGINILAAAGRPFTGTKLRGLVEAAGFRLGGGAFLYPDAQGNARFTLENQGEPGFTPESLRTLTSTGVTLLLDVPRQADGLAAFDQMVQVGRQLATAVGGSLVDDNNIPVSESGLEQIRAQLRSIYAAMANQGIAPGGPVALRLFS